MVLIGLKRSAGLDFAVSGSKRRKIDETCFVECSNQQNYFSKLQPITDTQFSPLNKNRLHSLEKLRIQTLITNEKTLCKNLMKSLEDICSARTVPTSTKEAALKLIADYRKKVIEDLNKLLDVDKENV